MGTILKYHRFLNEMWDTVLDVTPVRKDFRDDEIATYEFETEGITYQVFLVCRRGYEESPDYFQLELHFSAKKDHASSFSNELTGKHNMQNVMAGVWKSVIQWSKEVCKGGYLITLIISSKSETQGDDRRSKIYSNFIARKATQVGMRITGSEDISDVYNEINRMLGDTTDKITTKYFVDKFPIERLKSL